MKSLGSCALSILSFMNVLFESHVRHIGTHIYSFIYFPHIRMTCRAIAMTILRELRNLHCNHAWIHLSSDGEHFSSPLFFTHFSKKTNSHHYPKICNFLTGHYRFHNFFFVHISRRKCFFAKYLLLYFLHWLKRFCFELKLLKLVLVFSMGV